MRLAVAAMLVWATIGQSAAQELTAAPEDRAPSEIAAAKANNPLMKTRPEWLSGPDYDFPDSEKALGHNGGVFVEGVLGVDGRLTHLAVGDSSGAPVLDAIALTAASGEVFSPARDENGEPIAVYFGEWFRFDNYRSTEGVGAAKYVCRQFVLDMDWWKQAHPDQSFSDHQFYTLVRGLGGVARMAQGMPAAKALSLETNASFDSRWAKAIEDCRRDPTARFADKMKPEGDHMLRLAKNLP